MITLHLSTAVLHAMAKFVDTDVQSQKRHDPLTGICLALVGPTSLVCKASNGHVSAFLALEGDTALLKLLNWDSDVNQFIVPAAPVVPALKSFGQSIILSYDTGLVTIRQATDEDSAGVELSTPTIQTLYPVYDELATRLNDVNANVSCSTFNPRLVKRFVDAAIKLGVDDSEVTLFFSQPDLQVIGVKFGSCESFYGLIAAGIPDQGDGRPPAWLLELTKGE